MSKKRSGGIISCSEVDEDTQLSREEDGIECDLSKGDKHSEVLDNIDISVLHILLLIDSRL